MSPDTWPRRPDINLKRELPELKPHVLHISADHPDPDERFSSLNMWTRVVAWIRRFRHNARHRSTKRVGSLSAKEVEEALNMYRHSHKQYFSKEIQKLENHQDLPHKSPLAPVCPFLDENGVLRVGGRLQNSELAAAATHPVILHRKSQLARLLAEQIRQRAQHAGWSNEGTSYQKVPWCPGWDAIIWS